MRQTFPRAVRSAVVAALLVAAACGSALAVETKAGYLAAMESITGDELMEYVERLASNDFAGREAGTPGGRAAGDYIAQRLAKLQLRGGAADGGYFQPFAPNYRNVLAWLPGSDPRYADQVVVVGAHYDHVGAGTWRNSRGPTGYIHPGADDNGSGIAGLLELAEALARLPAPPKRSILLIAFDAEEKGLFGARHWTAHPTTPLERVAAMINIDMIGRLGQQRLKVFGARSGAGLRRLASQQNARTDLGLDFDWQISDEADHYPFFERRIPFLMLHTGTHDEYHTPRDTPRLIDRAGLTRASRLLFALVYELADRAERPAFRPLAARETESVRRALDARPPRLTDRLGIGWEPPRGREDAPRVSWVAAGSAAAKAGLRAGDRVLSFAGRPIRSADDLTAAAQLADSPAAIAVRRHGEPQPVEIALPLEGSPMRLGIAWRVDDAEPGALVVTYVVPGSPAAIAGLRRGDRVYQIDGWDFADDTEFIAMARILADPITLTIERDGRVQTVIVQLAAPQRRAA
jgi:uncharacterized metal-binding protein